MGKKINSSATLCYHIILGIKRLDKVANSDVSTKMREPYLMSTVYERQLTWADHALRREENEPGHIFALYQQSHGKAALGRSLFSANHNHP